MADNEAKIVISGDSKAAVDAFNALIAKFDEVKDKGPKAAKESSAAFDVFKGVLAAEAFKVGLRAIATGFDEISSFVKDSIGEAAAAEAANQKLAFALQQTGNFSEAAVKGLSDFATELQNTTKFSDEQITTSAALIESLAALDEQGLKRATKASADLATALGVDLETASRLVAKSAGGSTEALQKFGIVIAETGDAGKDFETVLATIEGKFGGAAAAAGQTFDGALTQLKNSFSDLQESVGGLITSSPALTGLLGGLGDAFKLFQKVIEDNKETVLAFIEGGIKFLVDALAIVPVAINTILELRQGFSSFFAFIGDSFDATVQSILEFSANITGAVATVQEFFGVNNEGAKALEANFQRAAEISQQERDARGADLIAEQAATEQKKAAVDDFFISVQDAINSRVELAKNADAAEIESSRNKYGQMANLSKADLERIKKDAADKKKADDKAKVDAQKDAKEKEQNLKSSLDISKGLISSSNKELFAIGKATSLATATVDGISAVQKALSSAPPPFNFVLAGIVGAAQALNLSKIANVQAPTGAMDGALVTGGNSFSDTQPFLLSKGEIVAPKNSFDEVVEGVAKERGFVKQGDGATQTQGVVNNYYINGEVIKDDDFIRILCDKIRDAVEFKGASLGTT